MVEKSGGSLNCVSSLTFFLSLDSQVDKNPMCRRIRIIHQPAQHSRLVARLRPTGPQNRGPKTGYAARPKAQPNAPRRMLCGHTLPTPPRIRFTSGGGSNKNQTRNGLSWSMEPRTENCGVFVAPTALAQPFAALAKPKLGAFFRGRKKRGFSFWFPKTKKRNHLDNRVAVFFSHCCWFLV